MSSNESGWFGCKKISRKGLTVEAALPKIPLLRKGAIAQLGERYNGIVEVVGSIPTGSTKFSSSTFHGSERLRPHRLEA